MPLRPDVLFTQEDLARFKEGFDQMAEITAVTYGPRGGTVAHRPELRNEVELLTDAATIARRIIALPDRARDMGAMLARHFIWRARQEVGDGSSLTAILAKAILDEATHLIAAGYNSQMLRRGIDQAVAVACQCLDEMAVPLEGEEEYSALATSILGDPALGKILGEAIDLVGADGTITVEEFVAPYLEREYVEGARVTWGLVSPYFETDEVRHEVVLDQPYLYITNNKLQSTADILPIIELVQNAGGKALCVIADQTQNDALAMLLINSQKGTVRCAAVKNEALGEQRVPSMEDLAILTGGRIILKDQGLTAKDVRLEDLGRARRIIVNQKETIIISGAGSAASVRQRVRLIRDEMRKIKPSDDNYAKLRERVSHLSAGVAIIKVGAFGERERKAMREQIENALLSISASIEDGMAPGGGAAYLACIRRLRRMNLTGDQQMGVKVVMRALEEPMRRLAISIGQHPPIVLAEAERRGFGFGFDVLAEKVVDMRKAGINDPVKVLKRALEIAASGACMAMTTEALVLHRKPSTETEP